MPRRGKSPVAFRKVVALNSGRLGVCVIEDRLSTGEVSSPSASVAAGLTEAWNVHTRDYWLYNSILNLKATFRTLGYTGCGGVEQPGSSPGP